MYKLLRQGGVQNIDTNAIIPQATDNSDWMRYQDWLTAGNTPLPADPLPAPTQDQLDVATAKAYTKLQALMGMTPAQVQAWVQANVTTLAAAQDAITTLAIAVSILARRL